MGFLCLADGGRSSSEMTGYVLIYTVSYPGICRVTVAVIVPEFVTTMGLQMCKKFGSRRKVFGA
jgi:hypothetical protein